MNYKNYLVYDDNDFFERYTEKRDRGNSPNDTIEKPIIDDLIGNVNGKDTLDLGCGDGKYGKELIKRGANHYYGIDGSINMIRLAKTNLKGYNSKIEKQDIILHKFQIGKYDLVLSRLVLHYIEHLEQILEGIKSSLKVNGEFVCSIEHPIITSCYDSYHQKTKRESWLVDNYFSTGERVNIWIGKKVVKYHKTIETYFQLFKNAGFEILDIRESKPIESNFEIKEEYERRMKIPLFMMYKLKRK